MGGEQAWKGKPFFLYIACCMTVLFGTVGCFTMLRQWQAEDRLSEARRLVLEGEYEGALHETNDVLHLYSDSLGAKGLYLLGVIYAQPGYPNANYKASVGFFQKLKTEFPDSLLREDAEAWIAVIQTLMERTAEISDQQHSKEAFEEKNQKIDLLTSEIEELKRQIEELKEVDIGIQEQKRTISGDRTKNGKHDEQSPGGRR